MNDATAQMGVQFGKSAVAAGQDYVEKNVSGSLQTSSCHLYPPRVLDGMLTPSAVYSISPFAIDQDLVLSHQLLRVEQAPTGPLPMETQALG
jgi:hypothetical protein